MPQAGLGYSTSLDNPIFLPYTDSEIFENPIAFRLADFADDDST
jgi:hypothetical protein